MKQPIIVVGMGELGSVFARGFLKLGYPVQAVTRNMTMSEVAEQIPNPTAVLFAVGEADIHKMIKACPSVWSNNVILLQNELLRRDWIDTEIISPTVISVWFEKKKGMDSKVVLPSPVYGKQGKLIFEALSQLDLPCVQLDSYEELAYELVRKNLYILTTNIAGLEVGGDVQILEQKHRELMNTVAEEVLDIQEWLMGQLCDRKKLITGLLEAFNGDPNHGCKGRSAPTRLKRALNYADEAHLEVPKLREIAQSQL